MEGISIWIKVTQTILPFYSLNLPGYTYIKQQTTYHFKALFNTLYGRNFLLYRNYQFLPSIKEPPLLSGTLEPQKKIAECFNKSELTLTGHLEKFLNSYFSQYKNRFSVHVAILNIIKNIYLSHRIIDSFPRISK